MALVTMWSCPPPLYVLYLMLRVSLSSRFLPRTRNRRRASLGVNGPGTGGPRDKRLCRILIPLSGSARGPLFGKMREGCGHRYVTMGAFEPPRRFALSHVTTAFLLGCQLQRGVLARGRTMEKSSDERVSVIAGNFFTRISRKSKAVGLV